MYRCTQAATEVSTYAYAYIPTILLIVAVYNQTSLSLHKHPVNNYIRITYICFFVRRLSKCVYTYVRVYIHTYTFIYYCFCFHMHLKIVNSLYIFIFKNLCKSTQSTAKPNTVNNYRFFIQSDHRCRILLQLLRQQLYIHI